MPEIDAILLKHCGDLPVETGVYLFYRDDSLLYVGKSVNLRQRVHSHFSAAKRGGKEARFVYAANRLEHEVCPSELSALLLESALIKAFNPLYNKRLRRQRQLWSWQLSTDQKQTLPQLIEHQWPPPVSQLQWGLFRSRTRAKEALRMLCRDEAFCEQTLGLSTGRGPCFQYQLKRCHGVCAGEEELRQHFVRVLRAFESRAHNFWPFPGAVAIQHDARSQQVSVLNAWNYLGDYENLETATKAIKNHSASGQGLDLDAFRIVLSFIRNSSHSNLIVPIL